MEEIVFQPLTPSKDQIDVKTAINNKRCNVATQKTDLVFTAGEFYTLFPLRDAPGHGRHNCFYLHRAQLVLLLNVDSVVLSYYPALLRGEGGGQNDPQQGGLQGPRHRHHVLPRRTAPVL